MAVCADWCCQGSLAGHLPRLLFPSALFSSGLPAVSLLAGCGVSGMESIIPNATGSTALRKAGPGAAFMLIVAVSVFLNRQVWFELKPAPASREIYGFDLFSQAGSVATLIQAITPPDARVAVLGSEPEIYFLSHRRPATSYLYAYALMKPQPFARRMQQKMIGAIDSARPECVAVLTFNVSRISGRNRTVKSLTGGIPTGRITIWSAAFPSPPRRRAAPF